MNEESSDVTSRRNNKAVHVRTNFLLFIKVLMRYLEKSLGDELLLEQAKLIVFRYRMLYCNQPDQMREMMHRDLRQLVGEATWNQAMKLTGFYLRKQRENQSMKKSIQQPQPIIVEPSLFPEPSLVFGMTDANQNDSLMTMEGGLSTTVDLLSTLEPNPIAVGLPVNNYPMGF